MSRDATMTVTLEVPMSTPDVMDHAYDDKFSAASMRMS